MVSNLGIAGILLSCCALIKMDPSVLCTVGTLAGQLKLKWDGQVSRGTLHRWSPGRAAGAEAGVGQEVPELSEQRVPWRDSWN